MTHQCPANNCTIDLPNHILMCRQHWFMVPRPLRNDVNYYWHNGPNAEYIATREAAIEAVNAQLVPKPSIKVLSIRQPWAWAILHAGKDIENRDWNNAYQQMIRLPQIVGQRIAIHASAAKGMTTKEYRDACTFMARIGVVDVPLPSELVYGAILGTVQLVDVVTHSASPWFVGEIGLVLRDPEPFDQPIPVKGALGLWVYEGELPTRAAEARAQAAGVRQG